MTEMQRMKSDTATIDRRETADKTLRDNRHRNDELTEERRSKADKTMEKNRLRNDEITSSRREIKDGNPNMFLAISLLVLIVLAVGIFFIYQTSTTPKDISFIETGVDTNLNDVNGEINDINTATSLDYNLEDINLNENMPDI